MNNATSAACKVVVLIGGSGSNLQALIDAMPNSHYEIVGVISHNPTAFGLERAKKAHIQTAIVDHTAFAERSHFEVALHEAIQNFKPDLVLLAGFMRILSDAFVTQYTSHLLNIHPSLLPKFKGLHTHQRALEQGETHHGASVHFVSAELDGGPVIAQTIIEVGEDASAEALQQRVLKTEHWLYPEIVNWFSNGRLKLSQNVVLLDNQPIPETGLQFIFTETEGIKQ